MIRRFARPYARAIMEVAASPAQAESIHAELGKFEAARQPSNQLADVFANPAVSADDKSGIAGKLSARLELSPLATRVIEVLVRSHRINDLAGILEALRAMINEELNRSVAKVRTAHDLDEAARRKLQATLESRFGRSVQVELETEPELLGGFVAQLGSEVWDASVVGQLNKLRTTLNE